ncbi:MAG TPA: hypothetical protein VLF14_05180, partial [Candidatus Binatia bacterium]|nr:hypothetical protein [Candidatus Binatia bacterium]
MRLAKWWVVTALITSLARAEVAPEAVGAIVGAIHFEAPGGIDETDYLRELPLQTGQRLSREALDESVRWLREKKTFASVEVDATMREGRADVTFRLERLPFVVAVGASGQRAVDEDTLLRSARIREDEPLS